MKRLLLASACLAGLCAPTLAADVVPTDVVPFDWSGFYIGAGGGWQSVLVETDHSLAVDLEVLGIPVGLPFPIPIFDTERTLGEQDGFGTVQIGFDWHVPDSQIVAGIFANYDFFDTQTDTKFCLVCADTFELANYRTDVELSDLWTVGGRLGWLASDTTLLYVLAGYSQANVEAHNDLAVPILLDDNFGLVSDDDNIDGWTVGGGIESMLGEHISLRLEYRYTDLEDANFDRRLGIPIAPGVPVEFVLDNHADIDTTVQSIRGVVSWKFNWFQ